MNLLTSLEKSSSIENDILGVKTSLEAVVTKAANRTAPDQAFL